MDSEKNIVLDFAEQHPYALLGAVGILVLIILIMWFQPKVISGFTGKRKGGKNADAEIDELIDEIHSKQKE